MFKYENCVCPYCGEPLCETDDLAVCPECGTPHHRRCYKEHGECANHARHGEGFEWAPPAGVSTAAVSAEQGGELVACLNCGAQNKLGVRFCDQCGAPMGYVQPRPQSGYDSAAHEPAAMPYELEQAIRENRQMDGFSIKDWITYIAANIGYYLYCFKLQDDSGRKVAFTWSAMLFPEAYFLYRKVWGAALAAFSVNMLLRVPMIVSVYLLPNGVSFGLSAAFWDGAANIFAVLSVAVNFCWGLFAVYLYRRSAVKKMTALRSACGTPQEFNARLREISGPSWLPVLLLLAPYALFSALMTMLIILLR